MRATLLRKYYPEVALGSWIFYDDNNRELMSLKTIELPDNGNKKKISCIPEKTYKVSIVERSNTFKYEHFWIEDVKDREGIKVHVANYVKELLGCIAPGSRHVDMNHDGIIDVSDSRKTLKAMLALIKKHTKDNVFYLTITS